MVADHNQNSGNEAKQKVFGIGLSRTGTTSLAIAMLRLGFRTCHACFNDDTYDSADAFFDTPIWVDYPLLDQRYPGSKFILTWRNPAKWYASLSKNIAPHIRMLRKIEPDTPVGKADQRAYLQMFGTTEPLTEAFLLSRYHQHRQQAEAYFRDRPEDLLIFDLDKLTDPWEALCRFLNMPKPAIPFPHTNPSGSIDAWNKINDINKVVEKPILGEKWMAWIQTNLERGSDPEYIFLTLLKNNFAVSQIHNVMGDKFPENSSLVRESELVKIWFAWVEKNFQNAAKSEDILNTLLENQAPLPVIRVAMGNRFPENSPRLKNNPPKPTTTYNPTGSDDTASRIFVQIASYRDPECQWTVKDMFEKAANPDRIAVGICWQYIPEEDARCFEIPVTRPKQIRTLTVHAHKTKGLGWARHQAQRLWDGEEYSLVIDSHMRFVPGWDVKLIEELKKCDSPKPVISYNPPGYTPPNNLWKNTPFSIKYAGSFSDTGQLLCKSMLLDTPLKKPVRGAFVAGGFIFTKSDIIPEVPYDPYIYFEEETPYSVRLYTHGWDVFVPTQPLIYHYYNNAKLNRPMHWKDVKKWGEMQKRSFQRYHHLVGHTVSDDAKITAEMEKYGLGTARAVEKYFKFSGVNLKTRKILKKCDFLESINKHRKAAA